MRRSNGREPTPRLNPNSRMHHASGAIYRRLPSSDVSGSGTQQHRPAPYGLNPRVSSRRIEEGRRGLHCGTTAELPALWGYNPKRIFTFLPTNAFAILNEHRPSCRRSGHWGPRIQALLILQISSPIARALQGSPCILRPLPGSGIPSCIPAQLSDARLHGRCGLRLSEFGNALANGANGSAPGW